MPIADNGTIGRRIRTVRVLHNTQVIRVRRAKVETVQHDHLAAIRAGIEGTGTGEGVNFRFAVAGGGAFGNLAVDDDLPVVVFAGADHIQTFNCNMVLRDEAVCRNILIPAAPVRHSVNSFPRR
jgi:hypothetical protein